MSNQIQEWALNHFNTSKEITFDLDMEHYDLQILLDEVSFKGTNWYREEFSVSGVKSYDENYNSHWIGILVVQAEGKEVSDFLELAQIFDEGNQ